MVIGCLLEHILWSNDGQRREEFEKLEIVPMWQADGATSICRWTSSIERII
jgi:hypothetical protein